MTDPANKGEPAENGGKSSRRRRTTQTTDEPQNTIEFPELPPQEYDVDLIDNFLDLVFGAVEDNTGEILTWRTSPGAQPRMPTTDTALLKHLKTSRRPQALYFSTATVTRNHQGQLRNRADQFHRLALVVLDDIGTKIPTERITASPTYILETSPGNYQYGYVFDELIDNLPAAKALIQLIYNAGVSDAGGKMPTKIVRLPEGVNGKPVDAKRGFITKISDASGGLWKPQALLDALNIDADWGLMLEDAERVLRQQSSVSTGSTPWADNAPAMPSLSGIIDPVLEWLYAEDAVLNDNAEWVQIICPWASTHTSGDNAAGYAPVGRGEQPHRRGFRCFHDHCASIITEDLLAYVAANGGPNSHVYDPVAELSRDWVYDVINDQAWFAGGENKPEGVTLPAFRNLYPRSAKVVFADGKEKLIKHAQLWITSPARTTVYGRMFDPTRKERIIEFQGQHRLNTYTPLARPSLPIDTWHVKRFMQFVTYLVPHPLDRKYLLNWLAAKVQDISFRGAAILMIAQSFGVGRSTFGDMLGALFGFESTENIPFDRLIGDQQFNDWRERPLIICDETQNIGGSDRYKAYERLKELIDPRPKPVRINPKYGRQYVSNTYSSYLLFSNHEGALHIPPDDRRVYVMRNAPKPASPSYFEGLAEWLQTRTTPGATEPDWVLHVWNHLQQQRVNMKALLAPPPVSEGKAIMCQSNETTMEQFVRLAVENSPSEYTSLTALTHCAELLSNDLSLLDMPKWKASLRNRVNAVTAGYHPSVTFRVNSTQHRPRLILNRVNDNSILSGKNAGKLSPAHKETLRNAVSDINTTVLAEKIGKKLTF